MKIDIFRLPNQTTILFWLIVLVFLGSVLLGAAVPAPIFLWPLALGLLLLPLRAYFNQPRRLFKESHLKFAGDEFAELKAELARQTQALGLRLVPRIAITPNEMFPVRSFGTYHHWYIGISETKARQWQNGLQDPLECKVYTSVMVHELYHFKTGDYWQMGYAGELFRTALGFIGWLLFFYLGYGYLMVTAGPAVLAMDPAVALQSLMVAMPEAESMLRGAFPSSEEMARLRSAAAGLQLSFILDFVMASLAPMIFTLALLFIFFWRKLLRMREVYADAGAAQTAGKTRPLIAALAGIPLQFLPQSPSALLTTVSPHGTLTWKSILEWLRKLFHYHPDTVERMRYLEDPSRMYCRWIDTAILAGTLVLTLDVYVLSPMTLMQVGAWPLHFPVLSALIIIALNYLIPNLLLKGRIRAVLADLVKISLVVTAIRLVLLLFLFALLGSLLLLSPKTLAEVLQYAISTTARYAGPIELLSLDELSFFVIKSFVVNTLQVAAIFGLLFLGLLAIAFFLKRVNSWYALPGREVKILWASYIVVAVITLIWATLLLPIITCVLTEPSRLFRLDNLALNVLGGLATLTVGLLFFFFHRRYAGRCPSCGQLVEGSFSVGKTCSQCHQTLHHWLLVNYE